MDAVVLMGLQASGKSSFYRDRFFATHVRISLDLVRTRHRESRLLQLCLETQQPFVIDNTNPTVAERAEYISQGQKHRFRVRGFYFRSSVRECVLRNSGRAEQVPDVAIFATSKKLQLPVWNEGFDELNYVRLEDGRFNVKEWSDEV